MQIQNFSTEIRSKQYCHTRLAWREEGEGGRCSSEEKKPSLLGLGEGRRVEGQGKEGKVFLNRAAYLQRRGRHGRLSEAREGCSGEAAISHQLHHEADQRLVGPRDCMETMYLKSGLVVDFMAFGSF
jgi:hypothetical protein